MLDKLLNRPVSVTMSILAVVVLGISLFAKLPVSLVPEMDAPYITIRFSEASFSARQMERTVTEPLRKMLIQMGGLEDLSAESYDGGCAIQLSFGLGTDMDYQLVQVNEVIDRCMSELPEIERPVVRKTSPSDIPAFFLDVTLRDASASDFQGLSRFVREVIIRRLEQLPEVSMVDATGMSDDQIMIIPDSRLMLNSGLSTESLETALRNSNVMLGKLTIREGEYRFGVKLESGLSDEKQIADVLLKCGDRIFRLGDVAKVQRQERRQTGISRSNGKRAVILAVIKQPDASMALFKKSVDDLLESFNKDYPEMEFCISRDQTGLLEYTIKNLLWGIVLALILSSLVIVLFQKDFRSPALILLTMPVSLAISVLFFYLAKVSLNILSLSGLLIGVGLMTDNSIILIDNISSRLSVSGDLRQSVMGGTREVSGPMLSSILTTCVVFVPMTFIGGVIGSLVRDYALSACIILLVSYCITILVIPVFYYTWHKNVKAPLRRDALDKKDLNGHLLILDARIMGWFLNHRSASWIIILASPLLAAIVFFIIPKERFPEMTRTDMILKINWNQNLSLDESISRTLRLEQLVSGRASIYDALVGEHQFVLSHSESQSLSGLSFYYSCNSQGVLNELQNSLGSFFSNNYPLASWSFEKTNTLFDMIFSSKDPPLVARVHSVDSDDISLGGIRSVERALKEALPGTDIPKIKYKTDVLLIPDLEKLALHGLGIRDLVSCLQGALGGYNLFSVIQGDKSIPVILCGTAEDCTISDLVSFTCIEKRNLRIPIRDLVTPVYAEDFASLFSGREGSYYPIVLSLPSRRVNDMMEVITPLVRQQEKYDVTYSGAFFSNKKLINEMILALLFAIIFLYLILSAQFESLIQPLLILLEINVDLVASLVVLWVSGNTLNIMSLMGFIVVSGIVVNDSILKIDTINRLRREGRPLRDAVMTASSKRMKAIIMTSLTTILAMVPMLFGGSIGADLQFPMSLVIIAGMTAGTIVSLFIIPSLYYSIYNGKQ